MEKAEAAPGFSTFYRLPVTAATSAAAHQVQGHQPQGKHDPADPPHLLVRLIVESALVREESRGSHFRADFPATSDAFEGHVVLRPGAEPALEPWR